MNKKTKQEIEVSNPTLSKELTSYEVARWYSLIDAVNIIGEKCEDSGKDFEKIELKPLEILRYVDYMSDIVYSKLLKC
jgi:hypothetical protein